MNHHPIIQNARRLLFITPREVFSRHTNNDAFCYTRSRPRIYNVVGVVVCASGSEMVVVQWDGTTPETPNVKRCG